MKGITFKPELLALILSGKKTQTRRLGGMKKMNDTYISQIKKFQKKASNEFRWDFEFLTNRDFSINLTANSNYKSGTKTDTSWFGVKSQYAPFEVIYLKEKFKCLQSRKTKTKILTLVEYADGSR